MRDIDRIVVHCSATSPGMDIGVAEIDAWHRDRGFAGIGYHFVIRRGGRVEDGRLVEQPGAHAKGYNKNSIGVCLAGGIDKLGNSENNFTKKQFDALRRVIGRLLAQYPGAELCGHRDLPNVHKDCPCFDVAKWWESEA